MISCLRRAGVDVVEHHVSVWEGRRHKWSLGPAAAARLGAGAGAAPRRRPASARPLRRRDRRLSGPLRPARRPRRSRAVARSSSTHSCRSTRRSSRTAGASRPGRRRRGCSAASTGSRCAEPTSSSPTPSRMRAPWRRWAACRAERVAVCFVGAEERVFTPGWSAPDAFHALFVGKLIPLHGARDDPRRGPARSGDPVPHRRQRPARRPAARPAGERRVGRLDRVRAPAGGAPRGRLRARHLRHVRQGEPRDPEQGVPGARVRDTARHRRHACGPRAPARRRERAARPAR